MDYAAARQNMVESQIRPNRVIDEAVIAAFASLPRERFVPLPLRGIAYVDDDARAAPHAARDERRGGLGGLLGRSSGEDEKPP